MVMQSEQGVSNHERTNKMSGCFGRHPEDRYMEGQLNAYLGSQDRMERRICVLYDEKMSSLAELKPYTTHSWHYSVLQDLIADISDENLFVPLAKAIQSNNYELAGKILVGMVEAELLKDATWDAENE